MWTLFMASSRRTREQGPRSAAGGGGSDMNGDGGADGWAKLTSVVYWDQDGEKRVRYSKPALLCSTAIASIGSSSTLVCSTLKN